MNALSFAIVQLIHSVISLYIWVVIITALLSFVNPDPYNPVVQFLYRVTNPAYVFIRKFIKTDFNGLDLAPIILIIGLQVIEILINYVFSLIARAL